MFKHINWRDMYLYSALAVDTSAYESQKDDNGIAGSDWPEMTVLN